MTDSTDRRTAEQIDQMKIQHLAQAAVNIAYHLGTKAEWEGADDLTIVTEILRNGGIPDWQGGEEHAYYEELVKHTPLRPTLSLDETHFISPYESDDVHVQVHGAPSLEQARLLAMSRTSGIFKVAYTEDAWDKPESACVKDFNWEHHITGLAEVGL